MTGRTQAPRLPFTARDEALFRRHAARTPDPAVRDAMWALLGAYERLRARVEELFDVAEAEWNSRCAWVFPADEKDPDARFLVPGCSGRVLDWDAECTCPTTGSELAAAKADARAARLEADRWREKAQDMHSAVLGLPNVRDIYAAFDRAAGETAARREQIRQANRRDRTARPTTNSRETSR